MTNQSLWLTGDPEADALLSSDDNALLIGMVLDQQVPMEKAFSGPLVIAQRMGGQLDVTKIAAMSEDEFIESLTTTGDPPIPGGHGQAHSPVRQVLTEDYDGQATNLWKDARSGDEVRANLGRLPGPGQGGHLHRGARQAAGITPEGWRTAAGYYGEPDTFRSVADIVDYDSLQKVRETKKSVKAAKKASSDSDPAVRTGP